ncbi:MAG TPA: alpha-amylase/4-alpha-glucanotransferase domain-containing protein, partial [bacterium]|nr:alpha-amylase/4-alpha-glucanotransferase domain-containing protein [bacterium]
NVLTRRREAYHAQLVAPAAPAEGEGLESIHTARVRVKDEGLERLLTVDRYRRASFLDHFLPDGSAIDGVLAGGASPLATAAYAARAARMGTGLFAVLTGEGGGPNGGGPVVRVRKRFEAEAAEPVLRAAYEVTNVSGAALRAVFGVETNWAITDPGAAVHVDGAAAPAGTRRTVENATRVAFSDVGWPGPVSLVLSRVAAVHLVPLETVSSSEGGLERIFQGLTCLAAWPLLLDPGARAELGLECRLGA